MISPSQISVLHSNMLSAMRSAVGHVITCHFLSTRVPCCLSPPSLLCSLPLPPPPSPFPLFPLPSPLPLPLPPSLPRRSYTFLPTQAMQS